MQQADTHPAYRADIDGMRAIAVLLVIGSHAFPATVPGGFIGVDIFFVISGFLISTIILKGLAKDSFSYLDFYSRRIRRIFPALLLVLVSCMVAGWFLLFAEEYQALGKHIAGGAGFIANFLYFGESGYFEGSRDYKPLLHLWSLGVEEQYYVLWPVFLGLMFRRTHRALSLIVGTLLLSFICDIWITADNPSAAFFLPITRFWELMIGSIIAYVSVFRRELYGVESRDADLGAALGWRSRRLLSELLAWSGVMLLAAALVLINPNRPYPGAWALLPALGAGALIAAGPAASVNRYALAFRPLVFIGLISYPLYLWHWPLLSFTRIVEYEPGREVRVVAVVAAVVLAWLTYRLLERPIRVSHKPSTAVALLGSMLVVAAIGIGIYAAGGFGGRDIQQGKQAQIALLSNGKTLNEHTRERLVSGRCEGLPVPADVKAFCSSYGKPGIGPIVVWGDSHAWAWMPVFVDIGKQLGVQVIAMLHPGCPPLLGIRRIDGAGIPSGCSAPGMGNGIVAAIADLKPRRVFLIARWSLYAQPHIIEAVRQGPSPDDSSVAASALASQLPETLKALSATAPVTVFRTTPELKSSVIRGLLRNVPLQPTAAERAQTEALSDPVLRAAADKIAGVDVFDPGELLCKQVCVAVLDGTLMYADDNHITSQGAMRFKDLLLRDYFP